MPRYFLHIDNGRGHETDDHGRDYRTPSLAIGEAARMVGELARNEAVEGATAVAAVVHVEDADGREIAHVRLTISERSNLS